MMRTRDSVATNHVHESSEMHENRWLGLEQVESLPEEEIQRRLGLTREILRKAGAHYVIDTFDQLPEVIEDVNLRLSRGERP